jgi:pimeloyl-ACP methyl ester carboxylesterase
MIPLIILHGALGSKVQLEPVKNHFALNGRQVYSLNFSGHGGAAFENIFGIERFAQDVADFFKTNNIRCADLFGYSMGGYVALWFAHLYPERVNEIITLGTKFDWSPESAEKEVKKLNADKILEKVPAFARILEHRHAPNDWKELLKKTSEMMLGLGHSPLLTSELLKSITTKTLILLGDQDDMADKNYSEEVATWLPNGKFKELVNTPHPIEKVNLEYLSNELTT